VRIASFNVENLFERAAALNLPTFEDGRKTLERHAKINALLNKPVYTADDKAEIVKLLKELGLSVSDDGGEFALLRQNRGHLLKRPSPGIIEIVANGRADWVGWVELKMAPVDELATRHTAMVIRDVKPDILGVVEAESRSALQDFSRILLPAVGGAAFEHVMLIDGNDDRGIDVGIMLKQEYEIEEIRSHVDDRDAKGIIFSRDCPEYRVTTPSGQRIVVLVNHLKSKGFGNQTSNDAKRRRQAQRVAEIYRRQQQEGEANLVVLGDFNDTPGSDPLAPLLGGTDLKDITTHPKFKSDGRPGTFENGTQADKIDYVLLSPALFARVTGGAIFRKRVWGGKNGTLWPHYPTMNSPVQAASDHAAIYADLDL
jgi:endonuclease/exonuclease/phosphatase family metal-dependent hydrolase